MCYDFIKFIWSVPVPDPYNLIGSGFGKRLGSEQIRIRNTAGST